MTDTQAKWLAIAVMFFIFAAGLKGIAVTHYSAQVEIAKAACDHDGHATVDEDKQ